MNIAIVGGGTRCRDLINLIERHAFQEIRPKVIAVADLREDAPGLVQAKERGLYTTNDYNDFFNRTDINLIIELTNSMDIYNDILSKKKKSVRAISTGTAQLFWEISRISELQRKTREQLQAKEEIYGALINELIQEDIMVISADCLIVDINDRLLKKLELERKEAIGCRCYEITHHQSVPCSGNEHPCPLVQTIKSRKPSQTTHVHLDKDDNQIFYSISCYPIFDNDNVVGAIEMSRDITKDINLQKIMMLQEKLASIGRLSAGVAHEINNPLTTILTTSMLMQEDIEKNDPVYQELETITHEALRCRKIVTGLLDFARQTKPSKNLINPNDVVRESIVLTRKQATFNDIIIEERLSDDIMDIYADKDQLEQALINLILNSIEATAGGGKVWVETAVQAQRKELEITVRDNGEGITADKVDKIFDPFYTSKENGTGLGLAVTHGIIEQHGGTISVESKTGLGTTFLIRLPINHEEKIAVV